MYPDGTATSPARYYHCIRYQPPLLLRRRQVGAGLVDEAYRGGRWQPTKLIIDYMFGHADDVEEITIPAGP